MARLCYGTTNMVALRRVNFYIGVSDPMTDILIERDFPADRIYTIYNGIDFKTPIQTVPKEEFLKSVGMKVGARGRYRGHRGAALPGKGRAHFAASHENRLRPEPRLKLLIGGDGEDRQKLEAMAKELGLSGKVCFAGWLNDVNSFYNAIDINLLTSISETFPYSLTEGTRMHRATIASSGWGACPVLIDDGVNGLIFEPGDENSLAQHLLTLAGDEELRRHLWGAHLRKSQPGVLHRQDGGAPAGDLREHPEAGRPPEGRKAGRYHHLRGIRPRQRRGRRRSEIHHPVGAGAGRHHAHHRARPETPRASKSGTG